MQVQTRLHLRAGRLGLAQTRLHLGAGRLLLIGTATHRDDRGLLLIGTATHRDDRGLLKVGAHGGLVLQRGGVQMRTSRRLLLPDPGEELEQRADRPNSSRLSFERR